MENGRPLLLVVATGMRPYREYLLRSISTQFRIHLFHTTAPQWEQQYLHGWTVLPDTWDGPAMARAALELAKADPISGVLCWDEGRIHATAYVAQALGLRNGDPDLIWRLRDKGQTRAVLDRAGIAQPRSVPVNTLAEALDAAEQVGYPAILKPRGYGASFGVVRVDDAAQLRQRFAFTREFTLPDPVVFDSDFPVLVEECVVGEEISVDSVIQDGALTPLFVARKVVGYPPYAEEIGHIVDAADPLLSDPVLLHALRDTHHALGVLDGWTHSEFMLTASGPQLIEVNGRLGGDMIPYLGRLATGIDPGLAAAAVACGLRPELGADRRQIAVIRFFYPREQDTTIASVGFDESRLPAAIDLAAPLAQSGAVVSPPPKGTLVGRIAFAIAIGDSARRCEHVLDQAQSALHVEVKSN